MIHKPEICGHLGIVTPTNHHSQGSVATWGRDEFFPREQTSADNSPAMLADYLKLFPINIPIFW